jgi:hypothetical protein
MVDRIDLLDNLQRDLGNTTHTDAIANNMVEKSGLDYVKIKNLYDGGYGDVSIINHKSGNYLKSLVGNNGMFDMVNPNVYKGIAAPVILNEMSKEKKQYGAGGTISNVGGAIGAIPTPWTAAMGGMLKVIGGLKENDEQVLLQQQALAKQVTQQGMASQAALTPGYLAPFAIGGITPEGTDIEAEKGEVLRNPQTGSLAKISEGAPSHAQGGVDISAEPGTQIYGKLKVKEGRFKGMSYKDAADKIRKEIARLEKN